MKLLHFCSSEKPDTDKELTDDPGRVKRAAKSEKTPKADSVKTVKTTKTVKSTSAPKSPKSTETVSEKPEKSDGVCIITRPLPLAPELYKLCHDLFMQWKCIKERLWFLDGKVREAEERVLFTLLQTAKEKCKGNTIRNYKGLSHMKNLYMTLS